MSETVSVTVRIAVAVDEDGNGYSQVVHRDTDKRSMGTIRRRLIKSVVEMQPKGIVQFAIVTATLPIPTAVEVEGEVSE